MKLDPLQHDRLILVAALQDVSELARFYSQRNLNLPPAEVVQKQAILDHETARLGMRLLEVQKKIEDRNLD